MRRSATGLIGDFPDRILPINADVALEAARLADIARPQHIELADLIVRGDGENPRALRTPDAQK